MKSLLLMSIVLAAIGVPILAARDPRAGRGLRRTVFGLFVFNALYLAYVTLAHVRLFIPRW